MRLERLCFVSIMLGASTPVIMKLLNIFLQWPMPEVPNEEKVVPGASWFDQRRVKLDFFSQVSYVVAISLCLGCVMRLFAFICIYIYVYISAVVLIQTIQFLGFRGCYF